MLLLNRLKFGFYLTTAYLLIMLSFSRHPVLEFSTWELLQEPPSLMYLTLLDL